MEAHSSCIVFDNGSDTIKAGFASDEAPRTIFPSIIGHLKHKGVICSGAVHGDIQDTYIGRSAQDRRDLCIVHPFELYSGSVKDWDGVERLWRHAYDHALKVQPEEYAVLMSEKEGTALREREKMSESIFESLGSPALHIASDAHLALCTTTQTTGVIVDMGASATHITAIHETKTLHVRRYDIGGRDTDELLMRRLNGYDSALPANVDLGVVRKMKERLCYVAYEHSLEFKEWQREVDGTKPKTIHQTYSLPDGKTIEISHERFNVPEAYFVASIIGYDIPGLAIQIFNTVMQCDSAIRGALFGNIVLAGGSSMYPGITERLTREMQDYVRGDHAERVKVVAQPDRKYATWIGGSIVASTVGNGWKWVTKAEYDEVGSSAVHRLFGVEGVIG